MDKKIEVIKKRIEQYQKIYNLGWELGDTSLMSIIVVLKNLHNLIINQTKERKN